MLTWPNNLLLVAGVVTVVALAAFVWWVRRSPGGEPVTALLWLGVQIGRAAVRERV